MMNIIYLCKRQYTGKDVINDQYGRLFELPFELSRLDVAVYCFSLSYQSRGYYRNSLKPKLEWTSIDFDIFHPHGIFKLIRKIMAYVQKYNPDVIIAGSDVVHLAIGRYVSKKTGIPLVSDLYDNFESYGLTKLPFMHSIYRNALKNSRAVTCVSRPLSRHVQPYCNPDCDIKTVENAVNHQVFKPLSQHESRRKLSLPEHAILIGTAGALYDSRDIAVLFNAYKLLQLEKPEIHLVLAGRSSSKMPIPDHVNVHYLGEIEHSDIAYFYNSLDVAIIPLTNSEFGRYCFPQKACEILACKRPLIASSVGVMKDLLKDYPECLFDDGNYRMLAEKILGQLKKNIIPSIAVASWESQAKAILKILLKVSNDGKNL